MRRTVLGSSVLVLCGGLATFGFACGTSSSNPGAGGDDGGQPSVDGGADATVISDASTDRPVHPPYDGSGPPGPARTAVTSDPADTHVDTQELLFAAGEMQISGEPFAEFFAGRNLNDYDRVFLPTDQYILNAGTADPVPTTDLFGFSTAVESYEYSKYVMNMVLQQTSAGVSLANGPMVAARAEATPLDKLRGRVGELLTTAGSDVAGFAQLPPPVNNVNNYLGFQGLWPEFAPFKSFDATLVPTHAVVQSCTFSGGYGGIPTINATLPQYECAYNSLHLPNRETQVEKTLVPAVMGLMSWKAALWAIDFTGRIHDAQSNPVTAVSHADMPLIGTANNVVVALDSPNQALGTFVGSTPLEGMWGFLMLDEMDNAAEMLVTRMTTADGATLGGFASRQAATGYDYTSPLRWFPAAMTVTEDSATPYPGIQSLAITDATSRAEDLAALLLGNAMFFGMTDARNAALGQRIGLQVTFDGAPFPADDGLVIGEATAHDRALALIRVAFVDLDRMHTDPTLGVITDTATVAAGTATPSSNVTTTTMGHVLIALRQTLLSLNSAITQYGASDPDPAADSKGILNEPAIHPLASGTQPLFSERIRGVFAKNAAFVRDVLTKADGTVANGATIASGVATPKAGAATLASQTAAIRALTEGFLVTGDESYRERARAVAKHLEAAFYSQAARMYRGVEGGADSVTVTPELYAWLSSALRETHKVLHVEGDAVLARPVLEDRVARSNKLFINGWDDLDGNQAVDLAKECLPSRMQLGEQALTGELGRDALGHSTIDRDSDCIKEIDDTGFASVLAGSVTFHSP